MMKTLNSNLTLSFNYLLAVVDTCVAYDYGKEASESFRTPYPRIQKMQGCFHRRIGEFAFTPSQCEKQINVRRREGPP
jgi:hypothetical protein